MKILRLPFIACLSVTLPSALAASFDCQKASTPMEQAICANDDLSALDDQLSLTYRAHLGSPELDPSGVAFGFETAERLLGDQFGNVELRRYPSRLHVTDPEDVFMALTSYPPGDGADEQTLDAFRQRIDAAFEQGGGVLVSEKETGVFLSIKAG